MKKPKKFSLYFFHIFFISYSIHIIIYITVQPCLYISTFYKKQSILKTFLNPVINQKYFGKPLTGRGGVRGLARNGREGGVDG